MDEERKRGQKILAITNSVRAQIELLKRGFAVKQLDDLLNASELGELHKIASQKELLWNKIKSDKKIIECARFGEINVWKIIEPDLKQICSLLDSLFVAAAKGPALSH